MAFFTIFRLILYEKILPTTNSELFSAILDAVECQRSLRSSSHQSSPRPFCPTQSLSWPSTEASVPCSRCAPAEQETRSGACLHLGLFSEGYSCVKQHRHVYSSFKQYIPHLLHSLLLIIRIIIVLFHLHLLLPVPKRRNTRPALDHNPCPPSQHPAQELPRPVVLLRAPRAPRGRAARLRGRGCGQQQGPAWRTRSCDPGSCSCSGRCTSSGL